MSNQADIMLMWMLNADSWIHNSECWMLNVEGDSKRLQKANKKEFITTNTNFDFKL